MEKPALLSETELKFLQKLSDYGVRYLIIGAAGAAIQGAPIATVNVDLWFENLSDPNLKKVLDEFGAIIVSGFGTAVMPPTLTAEGISNLDIVTYAHGLKDFSFEFDHHRETIDLYGIKTYVLSLERIIESKRATNRPKDRAILPQLETVLETLRKVKK